MGSTPPADASGGIPLERPLTTEEVEELVVRLSSRFGWDPGWNDPVIERVWMKGRTGNRFALVRGRDGADRILIKSIGADDETGPDSQLASTVATRMDQVADVLALRCPTHAHGPRPLGWLEDPAVVVMPFIEGTSLAEVSNQPDHALWETPAVITGWMSSAGIALGAFHDYGPTGKKVEAHALADLERMLRRYHLPSAGRATLLDYAIQPGVLAPRYADFASSNVLGQSDGRVAVLDPPIGLSLAPRQRDIAHFLFLLDRKLAGIAPGSTRTLDSERGMTMRRDFLAGYQAQSGVKVDAGPGRVLLAMYESVEALAMVRRRVRRSSKDPLGSWSRWRSAAWATRIGFGRRVTVARALRHSD